MKHTEAAEIISKLPLRVDYMFADQEFITKKHYYTKLKVHGERILLWFEDLYININQQTKTEVYLICKNFSTKESLNAMIADSKEELKKFNG